MALEINDLGNRIIINGTTSTSERVKVGPMVIQSVLWKGPTTVNHKASFVDENGEDEFAFECLAAQQPMSDDWPLGHMTLTDLYCDDLDSGTIIIYYKSYM